MQQIRRAHSYISAFDRNVLGELMSESRLRTFPIGHDDISRSDTVPIGHRSDRTQFRSDTIPIGHKPM